MTPLQISDRVFERELPDLLREHPGEWVIYHKDRRLGIRPTEAEAEQIAVDQGIPEDQTYIRLIEEEPPLSFGCSA